MNTVGNEIKKDVDVIAWATKHLHQKGEEVVLRITEYTETGETRRQRRRSDVATAAATQQRNPMGM